MALKTATRIGRILLAALLCMALSAFDSVVDTGKAQAHGVATALADAADHAAPVDGDPADAAHADRHLSDHSHDTPAGPARVAQPLRGATDGRPCRPVAALAALNPPPDDRPPQQARRET